MIRLRWPLMLLTILLIACNTTAQAIVLPTVTPLVYTTNEPFDNAQPTAVSPTFIPISSPPTATPAPTAIPTPPLPVIRQISQGDCCTGVYWNAESTEVRFIDRPAADQPVGIWGIAVSQLETAPYPVSERLGYYNQDGTILAYPDKISGRVIIERLDDGQTWSIDTQGSSISFTPDDRLMWIVNDSDIWWQSQRGDVWLADSDGGNAHILVTLQRANLLAWLSDTELLISRRLPPSQDTLLSRLSLEAGSIEDIVQLPPIRSLLFSPNRRTMIYMTRFEGDAGSGVWLLDLTAAHPQPERLPFFGSYRWRNDHQILYIPFDPAATRHVFYEYDLDSRQSRPLFPTDGETRFIIANNDWQVSPDGRKIAFVAAKGTALDGIWVIDLDQEQ